MDQVAVIRADLKAALASPSTQEASHDLQAVALKITDAFIDATQNSSDDVCKGLLESLLEFSVEQNGGELLNAVLFDIFLSVTVCIDTASTECVVLASRLLTKLAEECVAREVLTLTLAALDQISW